MMVNFDANSRPMAQKRILILIDLIGPWNLAIDFLRTQLFDEYPPDDDGYNNCRNIRFQEYNGDIFLIAIAKIDTEH